MSRVALLAISVGMACTPEFEQRPSTIESPRILAVVAEPPEAAPGESVRLRVVVADAAGPVEVPLAYWAFCTTRKAAAENNAVDRACWDQRYEPLGGPSAELEASLPEDACTQFGPEISSEGERPNDPDKTGGYYQPIRVAIPELAAFGFERLRCRLPNAPPELVADYNQRAKPNQNPRIESFEPLTPSAANTDNKSVRLRLSVAEPELYLRYDQTSVTLVEETEQLRAAFFTNAGELSADALELDDTSVELSWTLPESALEGTVWVVLRDSRGGTAEAHFSVPDPAD